jgi:phosphoserine phosphatase
MLRLAVFDLDGTLMRGPSCCELIAASIGRSAEMAAFEAASGDRQVRAAREEMARWYAKVERTRLSNVIAGARLAPGAEEACAMLRHAGVDLAIASVTWSFAVDAVADRLGIVHRLGTTLGEDGVIGHVWPADKAAFLGRLMSELGIARNQTAAAGDRAEICPSSRPPGSQSLSVGSRPQGSRRTWCIYPKPTCATSPPQCSRTSSIAARAVIPPRADAFENRRLWGAAFGGPLRLS